MTNRRIPKPKVLYLLPTFNIYGGTPKKTLDLIRLSLVSSHLYVWSSGAQKHKQLFEEAGAKIYEGYHGRNILRHLKKLLKIIDDNKIEIIQTQFSFGELLAGITKALRPHVKIVVAFVGSSSPTGLKRIVNNIIYRNVDHFVYVSSFVQREKFKSFPALIKSNGTIVHNGTQKRVDNNENCRELKELSLFDIAGLTELKNIKVLIKAVYLLVQTYGHDNIRLYIAGDGPERNILESQISSLELNGYVFLLGYQSNVGRLLNNCSIFVHPCYAEGFGIAVTEAMMAGKPIVCSNAGALPELVVHGESGLLVDPHDASAWAQAINTLIEDREFSTKLADNAKGRANQLFSIKRYVASYEELYKQVIG